MLFLLLFLMNKIFGRVDKIRQILALPGGSPECCFVDLAFILQTFLVFNHRKNIKTEGERGV